MKLYCKYCKKTINRDMRKKGEKIAMTKKGYYSYCIDYKKMVYLKNL